MTTCVAHVVTYCIWRFGRHAWGDCCALGTSKWLSAQGFMPAALLDCNERWKSVHYVSHRLMPMTWWWNTNTLSLSVLMFVGEALYIFLSYYAYFVFYYPARLIILSTWSDVTVCCCQLATWHILPRRAHGVVFSGLECESSAWQVTAMPREQ